MTKLDLGLERLNLTFALCGPGFWSMVSLVLVHAIQFLDAGYMWLCVSECVGPNQVVLHDTYGLANVREWGLG